MKSNQQTLFNENHDDYVQCKFNGVSNGSIDCMFTIFSSGKFVQLLQFR